MPERCPRCRHRLADPRRLVCPRCGYSLRLPIVGKAGAVLLAGALVAYVAALFSPEEVWVDVLAGGIAATVVGTVALVAAGWLLGRDRRRPEET